MHGHIYFVPTPINVVKQYYRASLPGKEISGTLEYDDAKGVCLVYDQNLSIDNETPCFWPLQYDPEKCCFKNHSDLFNVTSEDLYIISEETLDNIIDSKNTFQDGTSMFSSEFQNMWQSNEDTVSLSRRIEIIFYIAVVLGLIYSTGMLFAIIPLTNLINPEDNAKPFTIVLLITLLLIAIAYAVSLRQEPKFLFFYHKEYKQLKSIQKERYQKYLYLLDQINAAKYCSAEVSEDWEITPNENGLFDQEYEENPDDQEIASDKNGLFNHEYNLFD